MALLGPDILKLKQQNDLASLISIMTTNSRETVRREAADALRDLIANIPREYMTVVTDAFIHALSADPDYGVRIIAGESLGIIKDTKALDTLIHSLLSDSNIYVRSIAANALGELGNDSATDALIRTLYSDSSFEVRVLAASALGNLKNPQAIEALIQVIQKDPNIDLKSAVAEALFQVGDTRAIGPLIEVATGNPDSDLRGGACEHLGQMKASQAVDALVYLMINDKESKVRRAAAEALDEIDDIKAADGLVYAMQTENEPLTLEAISSAISDIRDIKVLTGLLNILQRDSNKIRRVLAVSALGGLGTGLYQAYTTGDSKKQNVPVFVGGNLPQIIEQISNVLISLLIHDPDSEIKLEAIAGLRFMNNPAAIEPICRTLLYDPVIEVRVSAADALAIIIKQNKEQKMIDTLRYAMANDRSEQVRYSADKALLNGGII